MFSLNDGHARGRRREYLEGQGRSRPVAVFGQQRPCRPQSQDRGFALRGGRILQVPCALRAIAGFAEETDTAQQEKERIDTQAWKHAELAETAKRAKARHDDTAARRGQTQARKDEIQHLLSALPRLTKLRALRERLDPLRELPDAPAGWAKTLPDLRDEEIRLETQIGTNAEEIERLTSAVEAIDVDDAALGLAGRLDDAVSMRARYLTAEKDLPERRQKLRDLNQTIAFHLRQVEREGDASPERFILPASTTERLRELIEGHSGIEIGVNKAAEELSEAKHRLEAAADKLAGSVNAASAADDRKYPLENLEGGVRRISRKRPHRSAAAGGTRLS